jgi:hypothetical protein
MAKSTPDPSVLESYKVVYRGGLADLPKPKIGEIAFKVKADEFVLEPSNATKKWWNELTIPYSKVNDLAIVARQVSTVEGLLGGVNSRQLNQDNNINIDYTDEHGNNVVLRVEMLTGVTVMGQAMKAKEFDDRLRVHGIRSKFAGAKDAAPTGGAPDHAAQLKQLADLRDAGVLTEDEFSSKKAEILARM